MKSNRHRKHRDRYSSGCGLCKPHKHGGAHASKVRERSRAEAAQAEIREALRSREPH